jgi:glycolate oxidase iron-sulfur subunit
MLKEYGHFLADDPDWASRAKRFSARVMDVSEFLATRTLPAMHPISAGSVRVTYQDACHLSHAQKITSQPRDLLRAIPGLELAEMPERSLCCGSAGVYNVTHPETARELGARKAESINATGAEVVVTANPGCYLQLRARLRATGSKTEVRHIMELLDEASAPVVAQ